MQYRKPRCCEWKFRENGAYESQGVKEETADKLLRVQIFFSWSEEDSKPGKTSKSLDSEVKTSGS